MWFLALGLTLVAGPPDYARATLWRATDQVFPSRRACERAAPRRRPFRCLKV